MGTWDTAILSNDTAADVAAEFKDSIAYGKSIEEAEDQLITNFCIDDEADPYEFCPFWLGLAAKQVQMGRLSERTKANALRIIDEGIDIAIWQDENPKLVPKRQAALDKLRKQIVGKQKKPTKVRKPFVDTIEWEEGDGLAYQLPSGKWTAFLVTSVVRNQRYQEAHCAVLDIQQAEIPQPDSFKNATRRLSIATIYELDEDGLIAPPIGNQGHDMSIEDINRLLQDRTITLDNRASNALGSSVFSISSHNKNDGPTGQLIKVASGLTNKYEFVTSYYAFGGWKDLDNHLAEDYGLI